MVRKIILGVLVLAVAVVPVPALARGGGQAFHGGHELHGGHERFGHGFHQFGGFDAPYPDEAYAPDSCYWQEGYWGPNQPYLGFERFEPVWVPGQSVCS